MYIWNIAQNILTELVMCDKLNKFVVFLLNCGAPNYLKHKQFPESVRQKTVPKSFANLTEAQLYHKINSSTGVSSWIFWKISNGFLICRTSAQNRIQYIQSSSGPCFPAFGVSLGIQSEWREIRTRKTPNINTFRVVIMLQYITVFIFDSNGNSIDPSNDWRQKFWIEL